jgi:leucyl/phenylalanyl-tRNA---protein transferase
VAAYTRGYFPMADESGRIAWYLPEARAVFLPGDAHVSRSTSRLLRRSRFRIAIDEDFATVIKACAAREPTWISDEIVALYVALYERGIAHSVECYDGATLAGGLYGVALGGAFFGESMFHSVTDASKVAFAALCERLEQGRFVLHDAQYMTPHLASLGAHEISRSNYLRLLAAALRQHCRFV